MSPVNDSQQFLLTQMLPQGDDNTSDNTSGVVTLVEEETSAPSVEDREVPASPAGEPNNTTADQNAECEFGIVEDYYDAEDPVPLHHLAQVLYYYSHLLGRLEDC